MNGFYISQIFFIGFVRLGEALRFRLGRSSLLFITDELEQLTAQGDEDSPPS